MKANSLVSAAFVAAAIVMVFVSACSTTSPGGDGGEGGTGGVGGAGGTGGPMFSDLETICRDWCRNEAQGPSCCFFDCRQGCLEDCVEEGMIGICAEESVAARACQVAFDCDDFFGDCENVVGAYDVCLVRQAAMEGCEAASVRCELTQAECLGVYDDDDPTCALLWNDYVSCVADQPLTCSRCAELFLQPPQQCSWPEGAAMDDWGGNPPACLDLPTEPFGCGQRCPGGSDSSCSTGTFCSSEVCDAECFDTGDCVEDLQCDPRGRCSVPPPQCGDGNMLDPTHPTAERVLECNVMGIGLGFRATFTANPTSAVMQAPNTFDLQMEYTVDENTVNLIINLANMATVTALTGIVVPTAGTSDTNSVSLIVTPVPCDIFFVQDTVINIAAPADQGTWNLDQGTTQELTLENATLEIDAAGLALVLSTEGDDPACMWADSDPPSLQFSLP